MKIKIEDNSTIKTPKRMMLHLENIIESLPNEHLRGIGRLRLVDTILDARLRTLPLNSQLPGLYHPRQGNQPAWLEVATGVLLPAQPRFKRLTQRLMLKVNMAAVIFSLVGQHYHLTLRHSIKKNQLETAVRTYADKQMQMWREQQNTLRTRVLKPFRPLLEKWGRQLQKRALAERKKSLTR